MSQHTSEMIRNLSNKALIAKIEAFAYSDDDQMRGWLINEAKRRGL